MKEGEILEKVQCKKYNFRKLRGIIIEKYYSQREFAKKMGWSERTMSLKMNNKRPWKQQDIKKACELLGIEDEDVEIYFHNEIKCE